MNRIYNDACDKNVAANVIYSNGTKFYFDDKLTEEIPAAEMLNIFCKGVVCKKGTSYYKPVSCTEAGAITFNFQ